VGAMKYGVEDVEAEVKRSDSAVDDGEGSDGVKVAVRPWPPQPSLCMACGY
jgi:hypothetical protein